MGLVTIQVLEGLERGQIYQNLQTPICIGREDDNDIRLNDERVSRFHAKIQEDEERIILTDLDSTNGTRVNGHPVQLRVLQPGDQLWLGRCVLVYGSREEIAERAKINPPMVTDDGQFTVQSPEPVDPSAMDDDYGELFVAGAPEPPQELRPVHRAQVSDMLSYLHDRMRQVLSAGTEEPSEGDQPGEVQLDWTSWQKLVALELDIAEYLRNLAEPDR